MKITPHHLRLALLLLLPLLTQCASKKPALTPAGAIVQNHAPVKTAANKAGGTAQAADDLDEYAVVEVSDPLERLNRATFWCNDKMYLVLFRPISKVYETVLPGKLRRGIDNAYDNARYPVRLVNCTLQGEFKRAGQNTEKFLINTVAGIGGLIRVSDKVPALADLPGEDTGKTFAKWGMGHGVYIVIPFLGPSSVRDGIGLAADYALNPIYWGGYLKGDHDWTAIPPTGNTLRLLPSGLATYDDMKRDALDPYIAIRSAYIQNRANEVTK